MSAPKPKPKPAWIARVARHWPSYAAVLDGKVCAYCGGQAETFSRMPKQDPVWYCRELCRNPKVATVKQKD
jgi:hypothetical protein